MIIQRITIISFMLSISLLGYAQYRDIFCGKNETPLHIEQIDYLENSTLLHIKYTGNADWITINEDAYLRGEDGAQYRLINSINLPITNEAESKVMVLDKDDKTHKFTLEFEKIPDSLYFDLIESTTIENAFNIYYVKVNRKVKSELIDISEYIAPYPLKERGSYIVDNQIVKYFRHKGLILAMCLEKNADYGKYFQVQFDIKNLKGKSILFRPGSVSARSYVTKGKKRELESLHVLPYDEYSRKIRNKQAWNSFFYGLGEGLAAAGAGYSSSTTTYSGQSRTNGYSSAYGYGSNGWRYASAYGSSYTTTYGRIATTSYNGAAAYAAQQIARQNAQNYRYQQYMIRERLEAGYAKTNTLHNQVEYSGYINIKYKKVDNLTVSFYIDGVMYNFNYVWE